MRGEPSRDEGWEGARRPASSWKIRDKAPGSDGQAVVHGMGRGQAQRISKPQSREQGVGLDQPLQRRVVVVVAWGRNELQGLSRTTRLGLTGQCQGARPLLRAESRLAQQGVEGRRQFEVAEDLLDESAPDFAAADPGDSSCRYLRPWQRRPSTVMHKWLRID